MKTSDLITALQKSLEHNGDVDVYFFDDVNGIIKVTACSYNAGGLGLPEHVLLDDWTVTELTYWGDFEKSGRTYIHSNCPVSHDEVVQRMGKPPGTIMLGMNAYVSENDPKCTFCGEVFDLDTAK